MVLLLCFLLPFLLPSLLLVRWLDCSLQVCIEAAVVSVSRRRLGPPTKFSAEDHRGRGTAVPAVACIALQMVGRTQATCRAAVAAAVVSHLATLLFITVSATTITIFLTAIAIAITITITIAIAITIAAFALSPRTPATLLLVLLLLLLLLLLRVALSPPALRGARSPAHAAVHGEGDLARANGLHPRVCVKCTAGEGELLVGRCGVDELERLLLSSDAQCREKEDFFDGESFIVSLLW